MKRGFIIVTGLTLLLGLVGHAGAASPEQKCQAKKYKAAGKYSACQARMQARFSNQDDTSFLGEKTPKCRAKYTATWAKLQGQFPGTSCAQARFVDNGNSTVTDNLTGLVWEKKTDDGTLHDKDDVYAWTSTFFGAADGSAFTTFLAALNSGACFAGQCDWRLPRQEELQTILLEYPCDTVPCIDTEFGPTQPFSYWSSTTYQFGASAVWTVGFGSGFVQADVKDNFFYVRAVRGGL
jgi:hypothetical protein